MSPRPSPRVLVVDDERNIRRVLQALLQDEGYAVDAAGDGDEARALLRKAEPPYDIVLTDLRMPDTDGMDLLRTVQRHHADTPVVMLTAYGTVDVAVEAMRAGAFDFITKPFEEQELTSVLAKALAQREAGRSHAWAPGPRPEGQQANEGLQDIVGESKPMAQLFGLVRKVAPSPTTILLRGESGTGKELFARALHDLSDRSEGPLVVVNCSAIPETLFESELFGHEKGAFTGATSARPGRFELADQGTLFLDEVGELPMAMQVKLLRVLQERTIQRVGGRAPIALDVRLVTATNADLEQLCDQGRFRRDLFYRLNVMPIVLPALRDRPGDVVVLARHFMSLFQERLSRRLRGLSPELEDALCRYSWPGNIRQLENTVERMVLLADDGDELGINDLPGELVAELSPDDVDTLPRPDEGASFKEIVKARTAQIERDLIGQALESARGNVTQAARLLGLSRKGLQNKMKEYRLRDGENAS